MLRISSRCLLRLERFRHHIVAFPNIDCYKNNNGKANDGASNSMISPTSPTILRRNFAGISMAQLKELRSVSGAPIVDCKKALAEADGDVQKAMDWLRQHGAAKASKKVSGRDAEEGLVSCIVSDDGKSAAIVKVSSETDFAGKSPAFVDFVTHVAGATLSSDSSGSLNPEDVLNLQVDNKSVQTALEEAIVAIRENLGVSTATKLTTDEKDGGGYLFSYVHGKVDGSTTAGSAASIVELVSLDGSDVDVDVMNEAGKKLAMHVVAAKPSYLDIESIPQDVIDNEKSILQSQIADDDSQKKKPSNVIEKIITGRLRKFYQEVCLTEQEHMLEESNPIVNKSLKSIGLAVKRFEYTSI